MKEVKAAKAPTEVKGLHKDLLAAIRLLLVPENYTLATDISPVYKGVTAAGAPRDIYFSLFGSWTPIPNTTLDAIILKLSAAASPRLVVTVSKAEEDLVTMQIPYAQHGVANAGDNFRFLLMITANSSTAGVPPEVLMTRQFRISFSGT